MRTNLKDSKEEVGRSNPMAKAAKTNFTPGQLRFLPGFSKKKNPDENKKQWNMYFKKEYGVYGEFLEDNAYIEIAPVTVSPEELAGVPTSERNSYSKDLRLQRQRDRDMDIKKLKEIKIQMSNDILAMLDEDLMNELDNTFPTMGELKALKSDPLQLWAKLKSIYQTQFTKCLDQVN